MTELLRTAIERLSRLPEEKQDVFAARILEELEAEEQTAPWAGDRHWVGGRKPTKEETAAAIVGLKAFRKGHTLGGLRIREMIEEGRR